MAKKNNENKAPRLLTRVGISRDLGYFIENISLLVGSGMSILDAVEGVGKELKSAKMRSIAGWIAREVEAGSPFSKALEQTNLFPAHTVSLIRIGEESGKLSQNLKMIGDQQEKDRLFQSKIRSALMYPVFVLSLTVIVGVGIAWFVLPKLALVFSQLELKLPLLTRVLISSGQFLSQYGEIAAPAFLVLSAVSIFLVFYFPKTRHLGQFLLFHMPGTGQLIRQVEVARFSYLLGTLLAAGLPVLDAVKSLSQATSFKKYGDFYLYLKKSIEEGNSFQKSFSEYRELKRLIPAPVQQMVAAGEKSGKLSEALAEINRSYEAKIENTTKNLAVVLEPILLVIVWLGVVAVALAVIMPIYSLIGQLNP